jgi:hypothetical protein
MTMPSKRFTLVVLGLILALLPQAVALATENAVVEARLLGDLKFLASSECEGRGITTQGINLAADYIANEFKKAGLKAVGEDGTYFQHFALNSGSQIGDGNSLALVGPQGQRIALEMGKHFNVVALGGTGKVNAPVVFAGYGLTSGEPKYDDYSGVNVEGKVVVVLRRVPQQNSAASPFAAGRNERGALLNKAHNAQLHKAAAILYVNETVTAAKDGDKLEEFGYTASSREVADIPAVLVRRSCINQMLRAAFNADLADVEKDIDLDLTPRSRVLEGWSCEIVTNVKRQATHVKNVIGALEGSGPLANETVVLGAHYDHLGFGGSGSLARGSSAIHHGADDNASGTTALIDLARRFGAMKERQGRRLVFMAFTAEESGLLGSAHYCKKPIFPLEQTVAMVNMDMVGRLREDKLTIGGTGTAKTFDGLLDELNKKHKLQIAKDKTGFGPSDHSSFYGKKIPVFFFYTGMHQQYHRPTDTWDTINVPGIRQVVELVEDVTAHLASVEKRPEYVQVAGSFNPGFSRTTSPGGTRGPRLGIMPSYADEKGGVLLEGVSDDGPAKKAGLLGGDRILEISGKPVKDVSAYMTIMAGFKRGDKVDIILLRKDEKKTISVVLE